MIRFVAALAMAVLSITTVFAPTRAEVAVQPEPDVSNTNFRASPITPGFWLFSNIRNASSDDIVEGCRDYVTFQFQDGYYFMLSMKKNAPESAEPRLSVATVMNSGVARSTGNPNPSTAMSRSPTTPAPPTRASLIFAIQRKTLRSK